MEVRDRVARYASMLKYSLTDGALTRIVNALRGAVEIDATLRSLFKEIGQKKSGRYVEESHVIDAISTIM